MTTKAPFVDTVDQDQAAHNMQSDLYLFPKRQILDPHEPKKFADDNFKFNEKGRKFSKRVENTEGKGEIARYEQFLLFSQSFQKTCIADT